MATILLIDDDATSRRTLRQYLEADGHEVTETEDGRAAEVYLADPTEFSMVVTDIFMPYVEGIEVILRMRREHPEIPCIAVSGGGRSRNLDFLDLARKAGAKATLAKPVKPNELKAAVRHCLG
tara:strand:- start:139 stop:507 length:369 start_codon:yes stop_codon:yes gene_type:complete